MWRTVAFVSGITLAGCGGSDREDLFGGGAGGSSGSGTGGSVSSGGSAGSVSSGGTGGGATGGSAGSTAGAGGSAGASGVGGEAGAAGVGGSGGAGGSGGSGAAGGAGGSGGTPPPGACTGHCGESQAQQGPSGYCWCDAQCLQSNDCCPDFASSCGSAGPGAVGCFDAGECKLGQGFCCMDYNDGQCVPHGSSCFDDASIWCDGPEDCGATQVCCGNLEQGGSGAYWVDFTCKTAVECGLSSDYVVCGSNASVCPPGTVCKQSGSLPQIKYCGQP